MGCKAPVLCCPGCSIKEKSSDLGAAMQPPSTSPSDRGHWPSLEGSQETAILSARSGIPLSQTKYSTYTCTSVRVVYVHVPGYTVMNREITTPLASIHLSTCSIPTGPTVGLGPERMAGENKPGWRADNHRWSRWPFCLLTTIHLYCTGKYLPRYASDPSPSKHRPTSELEVKRGTRMIFAREREEAEEDGRRKLHSRCRVGSLQVMMCRLSCHVHQSRHWSLMAHMTRRKEGPSTLPSSETALLG